MKSLFVKLWNDDAGIVALEYILLATIVGLGLVVGMSNLEIALDNELTELANAITALDQSYSFVTVQGRGMQLTSQKNGTQAIDQFGKQTEIVVAPSASNINVAVP